MRIHPLAATLMGPFVGLLGAGMWVSGWRKTGLWFTLAGLPGFVAGVIVLARMQAYWNAPLPAWWVPAAVAAILYCIAAPAAWLLGVVAWDRSR